MSKLIKKETGERVKVAGAVLPDGQTLVEHTNGGRLEVLNIKELTVVDD